MGILASGPRLLRSRVKSFFDSALFRFQSLPKECGSWPEWRELELRAAEKGPPQLFEELQTWQGLEIPLI